MRQLLMFAGLMAALVACAAAPVAPNDAALADAAATEEVATDVETADTDDAAEEEAVVATPRVTTDNPGISDTQNFDALSENESIAENAARLAEQRKQFQQVAPTTLPTRTTTGPNAAEFALSTTNKLGEKIHSRLAIGGDAMRKRNCARFRNADEAQIAFLEAGGPKTDRYGIDPDGDGFACDFDPEFYRRLVKK